MNDKLDLLKRSLYPFGLESSIYVRLTQQIQSTIYLIQISRLDSYVIRVITEWQKGTDIIMRQHMSDRSKFKKLLPFYRLASLDEIRAYIDNFILIPYQTELFKF